MNISEILVGVKNWVLEKLSKKQSTLVSGSNIKTLNGNSILGSGNLAVGTVTNVSAGTGLSVSGTSSVSPKVNVASGYKLPTTTEWNAKAPLASPALTGTPTAPTAAAGTNTTQIATTAFVNTAIDNLPKPMQFKGSLGTGGTITSLPDASEANIGWTYQVITAGTYAGQTADVGDVFISTGTEWTLIPSGDEPTGTVTSVGAGTGLSISGNPAIDPTVNVASGYKLPTTTEWEEKEDTFWATYSTTSYADILAAHNAGKVVLCNISGTIAQLTSIDSTNNKVTFTAEHSNGVLSVDVNANGWSVPSSVSFEKTSNKVTSLSSSSTNTQYPSAKVVYDTAEGLRESDAEMQESMEQSIDDGTSVYQSAQKFLFRKTGGSSLVMDANNGLIKSIKGRTLVWNQLAQIPATSSTRTGQGLTITDNRDGTYTINGTSTSGAYFEFADTGSLYLNTGHKHFWACFLLSGTISGSAYVGDGYISDDVECGSAVILDAVRAARRFFMKAANGVVFTNAKIAPMCIDLTLLGWVPSTVDEFRAVYPLSYYSYTPALLINNAATDLESTGFNQWDEVWELGNISSSTGNNSADNSMIRAKNYIPSFPSTTYFIKADAIVYFYDSAKNYISYLPKNNTTFTTPNNCWFMRFRCGTGYGTTYSHDICINISDASRNGTYEPYWKATRHLGLDSIQAKEVGSDTIVTINGLDGVGDNVDLLKEGKTLIKNRARVDLGNINWTAVTLTDETIAFSSLDQISDGYTAQSGPTWGLICSKYQCYERIIGNNANMGDKLLWQRYAPNSLRVYIKDSAYTDPAAFKAAMAGVMLDYPLATPKEYELVKPINTNYRVDKGGTEKFLPEQTASVILPPVECDMKYKNIGVEGYKLITDAMWDGKADLAGSSTQDFAAKDLTVSHIKYNGQTFNLNPTQGGQLALTTDIPLAQAQPQVVEDTTNLVRFFNGTIIMDKDAASTITYDLHDFFDYYCRSLGINPDDSTRYGNLGLKCFALTDFLYNSKIIKEHVPVQQQTAICPYIRTLSTYSRDVAVNVLSVYNLTITYKASDNTTSHLYLEVNGDSSGMQVRLTNS